MPGPAFAGEDDLDAPDLLGPAPESDKARIGSTVCVNGSQQGISGGPTGRTKGKKAESPVLTRELSADLSASLRTELIREIEGLGAPDEAALWAHRKLPAKNQLSATDAEQVEVAFAAKLDSMHPADPGENVSDKTGISEIDKSVLAFPEPRRIRDRDHVRHGWGSGRRPQTRQGCLIT